MIVEMAIKTIVPIFKYTSDVLSYIRMYDAQFLFIVFEMS